MSGSTTRTGVKMSPEAAATLRVAKDTGSKKPETEHRAKPHLHGSIKSAKSNG